ncbi:substrate-binding domain-containing protein [Sodalis sp. RH20]|uniref:substrate-binding domain-containing protein n=1 Tax=unclassified Sodalis (in: enterobacteria) TaxID=2636512 RepID=UPI0039B3F394
MRSIDVSTEIRLAVLGDWVPPQLADVLAIQRAEEPETIAVLIGTAATGQQQERPDDSFDFALSAAHQEWPGWVCEPLWHDTLAVAVAKRSHLLAYHEVPCQEALKQPLIYARSTDEASWRTAAQSAFENELWDREEAVSTFEVAMTMVAAGYGIAVAPSKRLAGYQCQGIALRPLASAPMIVTAYLIRPDASLTAPQESFLRRARSMS